MKKSRFMEEQIAFAPGQAEAGIKVAEICRRMKVSELTFFRRKKQFGRLDTAKPSEQR